MNYIQTSVAALMLLFAMSTHAATYEETAKAEQNNRLEEAFAREVVPAYQAANPKPVLSEEARKFKVQAEFAVHERQFDKAVQLYGKALEIAPWWPEGHFNQALILGEINNH